MSNSDDNDRYELTWEIRYGMRFGRRQSRLLDRIANAIKALTIIAGSAAFIGVIAKYDALVKWSGVIVAALAIGDAIWNPTGKAARSREIENRYAMVNRHAAELSTEELRREVDDVYDAHTPELELLRYVAYNDVVSECGNSDKEKYRLNLWQRLIAALA